mmetsp:Transcript_36336/g.97082  ORF Transcript_36336/g.97082 Transcript_36336/m.97082 type:complete len:89 (+) Transcript_36336:68-334(+)
MAALSNGSDGPPARPSKKLAPRLRASCEACRKRKSRCDGTQPCHRCSRADIPCVYELAQYHNRTRKRKTELRDMVKHALRRRSPLLAK